MPGRIILCARNSTILNVSKYTFTPNNLLCILTFQLCRCHPLPLITPASPPPSTVPCTAKPTPSLAHRPSYSTHSSFPARPSLPQHAAFAHAQRTRIAQSQRCSVSRGNKLVPGFAVPNRSHGGIRSSGSRSRHVWREMPCRYVWAAVWRCGDEACGGDWIGGGAVFVGCGGCGGCRGMGAWTWGA